MARSQACSKKGKQVDIATRGGIVALRRVKQRNRRGQLKPLPFDIIADTVNVPKQTCHDIYNHALTQAEESKENQNPLCSSNVKPKERPGAPLVL
jgi:hypothetical protein